MTVWVSCRVLTVVILKELDPTVISRPLTMFRHNLIHIMAMLKATVISEMWMEKKDPGLTNRIG
jgi:hypothetical protein